MDLIEQDTWLYRLWILLRITWSLFDSDPYCAVAGPYHLEPLLSSSESLLSVVLIDQHLLLIVNDPY